MTVFQALVLGVLQGLAEFLPISSSAHLALTPWLFGWPAPGLAFDTSLHLGTLIAVLWYFQEEWRRLIASAWEIVRTRQVATDSQRRVVFLVVATIPGGIAGLLLEDLAETVFRAPVITAIALIALGILLWGVDRWASHDRPLDGMRWGDALLFGLAQVAALVPGVSRSGATMTMGRALRFTREGAAVFSFLMSMPITLAAVMVKLPDAVREREVILPLIVGVIASGASGWLAISVLLKFVARHSFGVFAVYRVALGLFVLALLAFRG
ncbi:MAG TPA: undecaprenyl-diphosphate phosphatase [Gemmatimonadaceae bacterium]|nr:undecaprenyl-diphosphate phosphatase [Gemmatimonadaceae bacterium]